MSEPKIGNGRFNPSRRKLLTGLAAAGAGVALSDCGQSSPLSNSVNTGPVPSTTLPNPEDSGIDNIVVVMMENRSFDHYLGWVPGAMGQQAGLSFTDTSGKTYQSHHLTNYQNCQSADPDHSYAGGRTEINGGKMDGFLLPQPVGDQFPIGYYTASDLPFHSQAVANWTICDRYFCSILSSTFPNRVYMHAGQTDRVSNTLDISSLPTIWDRLASVGKTGRYYFNDEPITALWGAKYLDISQPYLLFLAEAAAGTLANVSYIDPAFLGEADGISRDDHPLADIRNGQAFLAEIYQALRTSPQWDSTLLVINYDEWGGFFDTIDPPFAPVTEAEVAATGNDGRLGCRVPVVIAGPRAKRAYIENLQFDHCSILNMLAWRFGFEPLGARGSTSYNLAYALDFENPPNNDAPAFDVPGGSFGSPCDLPTILTSGTSTRDLEVAQRRLAEHLLDWEGLRTQAKRYGFKVK
jgi:phospholipase C